MKAIIAYLKMIGKNVAYRLRYDVISPGIAEIGPDFIEDTTNNAKIIIRCQSKTTFDHLHFRQKICNPPA